MPPKEEMATTDFVIRPPTTTGDDAQPSGSLLRDVHRILALMQDERIMAAHGLYNSVHSRLDEWKAQQKQSPTKRLKKFAMRSSKKADMSVHPTEDHEYRAANDILESKREELDKLNVCCRVWVVVSFVWSSFCF